MRTKLVDFPKVYILILNWNGWRDTIECLESVFRNTYPNYQVVVIDNGSTDGSMEKIKAWAEGKQEVLTPNPSHPLYHLSHPPVQKPIPYIEYDRKTAETGGLLEKEKELYKKLPNGIPHPLILIQTGDNLGFAGGNNVGIRYALSKNDCEYICLLNNDTIVEKSFLSELLKAAKYDPKAGIIGGKILYYDNPEKIWYAGGKFHWYKQGIHVGYNKKDKAFYKGVKNTDWVSGCTLLISKKVINGIGFLDDNFFLYGEDTDFCYRANKAGFVTKINLDALIYHKVSKSTGLGSSISFYYGTRNRLYYHKKHRSSMLDQVVFFVAVVSTRLIRISQWILKGRFDLIYATYKGIRDYLKGNMGRNSLY